MFKHTQIRRVEIKAERKKIFPALISRRFHLTKLSQIIPLSNSGKFETWMQSFGVARDRWEQVLVKDGGLPFDARADPRRKLAYNLRLKHPNRSMISTLALSLQRLMTSAGYWEWGGPPIFTTLIPMAKFAQ
jgi:hypothetical protein